MVIVGILVAGAVSAYDIYLQNKKVTVTRENQQTVKDAIDEFLAANGRYPCPAPVDSRPGDSEMGTEVCTAPDITVVIGMRDVDGLPGNDPVLIGTVPTRTLNLSDQIMRDGYGRRMTYAVSATLTNDATFENENGVIAIEDADGNSAINPADAGHFTIISHGPDGLGAYSAEGVLYEGCTGATKDTENCDYSDAVFISTLQRSTASNASHYDDFTLHAVKLTPLNPLAGLTCPSGQVISGYDDTGQPICVSVAAGAVTCSAGQVVTGFDGQGNPLCTSAHSGVVSCPSGQAISGFNVNGQPTCIKAGGGGGGGGGCHPSTGSSCGCSGIIMCSGECSDGPCGD